MIFTMVPEWAEQEWVWIGFPHDGDLWEENLAPAQEEIAALANAIAASGQEVRLVVRDDATASRARELVDNAVKIEQHPYGDIWIRDTGPLVLRGPDGEARAQGFGFNGWGGKFIMEGDQETGASLAQSGGLPYDRADWVLEGGAIDIDGTGLLVTTEQCLLNANRNPDLSREDIAARLKNDLGARKILWLGDGLMGDHTDGHVDNLARFVGDGKIAIPASNGPNDPNHAIYEDALKRALAAGLEVAEIPSATAQIAQDEEAEPASYMNFLITNALVIVPIYGEPMDDAAVTAVAKLFPTRATIGLPANAILTGGGSFHCASQHAPKTP